MNLLYVINFVCVSWNINVSCLELMVKHDQITINIWFNIGIILSRIAFLTSDYHQHQWILPPIYGRSLFFAVISSWLTPLNLLDLNLTSFISSFRLIAIILNLIIPPPSNLIVVRIMIFVHFYYHFVVLLLSNLLQLKCRRQCSKEKKDRWVQQRESWLLYCSRASYRNCSIFFPNEKNW